MRELYIQSRGKTDCQGILGAFLGLGADPEKIRQKLEVLFHFPVRIFSERCSEEGRRASVEGGKKERISIEQAKRYFEDMEKDSFVKVLVFKILELLRESVRAGKETPCISLSGEETCLVLLTALAFALDDLGFASFRVLELEETLGIWKEELIPSEEILRILEKGKISLRFSQGEEEKLTPGSAAFLAAAGKMAEETGKKRIVNWAWGAAGEGRETGITRGVILEEDRDRAEEGKEQDRVQVLETNVDDCSGEQLGYTIDRLMKAGALDASCFPIFMKKNRPAYMLQVICKKEKQEELEDIIFRETTSIGLRRYEENRRILPRSFKEVTLRDGHKVKIKICCHHGQKFYYPEYDTVRKVCEETGRPYRNVYDEAAALTGGFDNDI